MSKISGENLLTQAVQTYWKQFAESATAWLRKYADDPFFRTEVNVIGLQAAFALVIIGLVATSFVYLDRDISRVIIGSIQEALVTKNPAALGPQIMERTDSIRHQHLLTIELVILCTTILFGYVVARITLRPARNALSSQKQFIGNIAHELRTPLSIIKTNTELALLDGRVTADLKNTLVSNVEELDRISEIINNLLSLSALIKPERVEFGSVDFSNVVGDVVKKYSQLASRGEYEITVRKSPDCLVWGNATALDQIVSNLVKNAINYTPRRGTIILTVSPAPNGTVEFIVQDSGIGISRKDLFRIFEPFYRASQSRTRTTTGTGSGLGLAIVSELVKLHGGKITIRSAVGRGTTVSVLLPAARAHAKVGSSERQEGLNEIAVDFSGKQG